MFCEDDKKFYNGIVYFYLMIFKDFDDDFDDDDLD